jgi:micrococcal nuclease
MKKMLIVGSVFLVIGCLYVSIAVPVAYKPLIKIKEKLSEMISTPTDQMLAQELEPTEKPLKQATATRKSTPTIRIFSTRKPTETHIPSVTSTPTATLAYQFLLDKPDREFGLVTKVMDGNTIVVVIYRQFLTVRYIGVEAPRLDAEDPAEAELAKRAAEFNKELVLGKVVMLVKDVSEVDKSDRLLRYVFVGGLPGQFVNYEMVKSGMAKVGYVPPDTACIEILTSAEKFAKQDTSWFWAAAPTPTQKRAASSQIAATPQSTTPAPSPTWQSTAQATSTINQREDCDESYPDVCIPSPPPILTCADVPYTNFVVRGDDPHGFDADHDGTGCEAE